MKLEPPWSSDGRALLDRIGRRGVLALFLVGLFAGVVVVGGVGLTTGTDAGDGRIGGLETELAELLGGSTDPTGGYGGGATGVANETGTLPNTAPESTPHAGPDPLADLEPDPADPGVSTLGRGTVTAIEIERHIHSRVNEIRRQRGLEPLAFSASLATYARAHSYDQYDRDYFAHENPDGESPADRISNAFAHCTVVGENLHYRTWGEADAERIADAAVEAWMNSETHRENLLREGWDVQGIGIYIGSAEGRAIVYSSQEFCTT